MATATDHEGRGIGKVETVELVIIEDEMGHFQLMKRAVEREFPNCSVHHFQEADVCLARLDTLNPDLIVTDYMVSGMNGIDFLKALRAKGRHFPVVMITGRGDEAIAVEAMKLGVKDYLVKSADFSKLLPQVIQRVLREQQLTASLEMTERRFREIFEHSPIGIGLYDGNGVLLDANKSCLEMFCAADVAELKAVRLFDDPNVPHEVRERLRQGEPVRYELPFYFDRVSQSGPYGTTGLRTAYFDFSITPITRSSKAARDGYLVQVQDISDQKEAEGHIRSLSQQLMRAQENERARLSRDLHDHLAQELSALKLGLDTLFGNDSEIDSETREKTTQLSRTLEQSIVAVRDLAYELRPPGLVRLGLVETIYQHCQDFSEKYAVSVDFFHAGIENLTLDYDAKIAVYRLIQEALNNVRQHARAGHITVRLVASFPKVILRIRDDGKGFDVPSRMASGGNEKRMGLRSMEERAALLGGSMRVESRPMEGTSITVEFPVRKKRSGKEEKRFTR